MPEILLSNIGDLTVAEAASARFELLVADRRSLPSHPALSYVGSIDGLASNVIKVSHVGLMGYDTAAQAVENAQVADTALTDGSSTVTVVRYSIARSASDLARIVRGGLINPASMAADALMCINNRKTQLICDVIDGYTLTAGTTGVDLDTADILAALGVAEIGNLTGPFMGVIHGRQWADWALDMGTAVGGSLQYKIDPEMIALRGESFKGSFLGVDWFVLNRVNSNGTDRQGAIFGPGALLWGDGTPPADDPSQQMMIGNKVLFERVREGRAATTGWVSHGYLGVSMGIQNALTLGSDAA